MTRRHGPFRDREERRTARALEYVQHAALGRLDHGRNRNSLHRHIAEHRLGSEVVVPKVVMNELLVPDEPAAAGIEREQ